MRPLVPADYPGGSRFKKASKRSSGGKASQARSTSSSVTGEALSTPSVGAVSSMAARKNRASGSMSGECMIDLRTVSSASPPCQLKNDGFSHSNCRCIFFGGSKRRMRSSFGNRAASDARQRTVAELSPPQTKSVFSSGSVNV